MNLTIRQLRYVCEVARLGSVQSASKSLTISQSSVLAAIALADGEMGARIFERRPARGVQTTPAGERFVSAARVMLSAATEFSRSIGDLSNRVPQVLRIGCFEPFGALFMPEMLRSYVDQVGDVEIDLLEGDQVQLQAWLTEGLIDVAILYDIGAIHTGSITRGRSAGHARGRFIGRYRNQTIRPARHAANRDLAAHPLRHFCQAPAGAVPHAVLRNCPLGSRVRLRHVDPQHAADRRRHLGWSCDGAPPDPGRSTSSNL